MKPLGVERGKPCAEDLTRARRFRRGGLRRVPTPRGATDAMHSAEEAARRGFPMARTPGSLRRLCERLRAVYGAAEGISGKNSAVYGRNWNMARICTICKHPKRGEIEAAIIDRASFRNIAERFAMSTTAVFRHAGKHLPAALTVAKKAEEVTRADTLLDRIEGLILDVRRIAQKAEKAGQWGQAASALREARACIELLARLRGELQAAAVNVGVGINVGGLIEAINCGRARAAQETAAEKGSV